MADIDERPASSGRAPLVLRYAIEHRYPLEGTPSCSAALRAADSGVLHLTDKYYGGCACLLA